MRRTKLVLGLSLLLVAVAGIQAVRWLTSPVDLGPRSRSRTSGRAISSAPPPAALAPQQGPGSRVGIDAGLPLYVGSTRRLAAQAIDDTAGAAMNQALISLARRSLARPYSAFPLDQLPRERLLLDLEHFDQLRLVEQLLALVNSRQVKTRTEAVDRFSDHVRKLRYRGGEVSYCQRHHDFSHWALAAEQQGYLVNLTPFLATATNRPLPQSDLASQPGPYRQLQQAANSSCLAKLAKQLASKQAYVPLAGLAALLPSLRNGDIYALVSQRPGLDVSDVGLVEVNGRQISAIQADAGSKMVRRSLDLVDLAKSSQGVIGLSIYRPIPNPDGKVDP